MNTYTMEDMKRDFDEAQSIVDQCGLTETDEIEYHLELAPTPHFLGQTHQIGYHNYIIRLNQLYAQTENKENHESIINTLIHEILHTLKDGMSHTGAWKRYASIIYQKKKINIARLTLNTEIVNYMEAKKNLMVAKNPNKVVYQVICPNCGKIGTFQRKCDRIKRIASEAGRFRCNKCNSRELTIKTVRLADI